MSRNIDTVKTTRPGIEFDFKFRHCLYVRKSRTTESFVFIGATDDFATRPVEKRVIFYSLVSRTPVESFAAETSVDQFI